MQHLPHSLSKQSLMNRAGMRQLFEVRHSSACPDSHVWLSLGVQALGIKPKTVRAPKQPSLDQRDMAQLMQRGEDEEEEDPARQAERIKGLGFRV